MSQLQRTYLEESARYRGDEVAIRSVDSGRTTTYGELDAAANSFGNALHDRGVRQGDRVGLVLYNTVEFPVALYGCHKRGFVPVALNYRFAAADFDHVFGETNPSAVVYDAAVADTVAPAAADHDVETQVVVGDDGGESFDRVQSSGSPERPPPLPRDGSDLSYMFYTSGTTGDPKAVAHSVRSGRERMVTSVFANQTHPATVCLLLLPFFHGGGMDSTLRAMVASGAELIITREPSWEGVADRIETHDVTDVRSVPTTLRRMIDNEELDGRDFGTLECWRATGAVLTESLARDAIEQVTPNLYNAYGSSEGGTNVVLRPSDLPEHAGTVGKPLVDNEIRVVEFAPGRDVAPDETVPQGENGEVVVRSPQLFRGYYENERASRDRVRDGWYYTHDVGVITDEGYLVIKGRTDDMILSGGELVSAVEVEAVLEDHDDVVEAIVVGREDDEWGQVVAAYVVPTAGADRSTLADDLDAYCRDHPELARYKRPRAYHFEDELAHNETGKKLRAEYQTE
jgi:acyl-CoA synthetase (AMP-forming)/AMP-acid ligase II